MKSRLQYVVFFTTVLLVAIACLNGCASTGIDRVKADTSQCGINTGCTGSGDLEATTKTGTGK
jgi:hypothetical protein